MDGNSRSGGIATTGRNPPHFFIPIMFDDILIFSGNEMFESTSNPFVGMHLFGLLLVVHGNPVIVFKVVLELVGFLELFEEKLMELVFAWAVFRIHTFKHPIEQLEKRLYLTVAEPLNLHQVSHVKVSLQSTIGRAVLQDILHPLSSRDIFASFLGLA